MKKKKISFIYKLVFLGLILLTCSTAAFGIPITTGIGAIEHDNSPIVINELAASNTYLLEDEDGDYSDWVELFNKSDDPVNLKGWYLSDNRMNLNKWMFTASKVLNPGEHLIIYLSGKDRRTGKDNSEYHTNFSLKENSETLYLSNINRTIMDSLEGLVEKANTSIGRVSDGVYQWEYKSYPTPGESNDLLIPTPVFIQQSGFYTIDSIITIEAETVPDGYELRYSLNDGIIVENDQAQNRNEWIYPSNNSGIFYENGIDISETSVLKARLYKGKSAGPQATYTYFINEDINIPVISLTVDPADFWDEKRGIYVTGSDPENPNYQQEDWEVPARFTYFSGETTNEPDIDLDVNIRIFGSATREFPNKSLAVFSRDREMPNLFFRNNSDSVYSLLLRAAASDFPRALMRDIITSELVQSLDLDSQDYQQAILFINGQFWSITNIREKINEEMIEDTYLIDPDKLDLIFATINTDARNGTLDAYSEMFDYITQTDLYISANYEKVSDYLDIDNFIDYIIIETFINNGDWPSNNVKTWRGWDENSLWKWIIYDTDASYDTEEFWSKSNPFENHVIGRSDFNSILRLLIMSSENQICNIFKSLMQSPIFKERFIGRYDELIGSTNGEITNTNAVLGTQNLTNIIENLALTIEPFIERQVNRWKPFFPSYMNPPREFRNDSGYENWLYQIQILKDFVQERPAYVAGFLETLDIEFEPSAKNIIENGSFDSGSENWNLRWSSEKTEQTVETMDENSIGKIVINNDYIQSENPADIVSFVYDLIPLEQAKTYSLSFAVRTNTLLSENETIRAYLFKSSPDYTRYADIQVAPTTEWQTVETRFTYSADTDKEARLQFRLGKLPPGAIIYLDEITLREMEVNP